MSLKALSLGQSANTTQCVNITAATNATPIEVTFTAGHSRMTGERIAIAGVTGNTAANGIWTLTMTATNTGTLNGSVGNGTFGGTVRVGVVCDATPFMRNHSAVFAAVGNHVGVVDIEAYGSYDDFAAGINSANAASPFGKQAGINNAAGGASTPAKSTLTTAATNAGFHAEAKLPLILRAVPTTATSGTFGAVVMA